MSLMVSLHNAVDITNDPHHEGLGLEAWESERIILNDPYKFLFVISACQIFDLLLCWNTTVVK